MDDHTLIIIFLRGAMDGLSYLVPHADPDYRAARPSLAIPSERVLELDGTFGWHPAAEPLLGLWSTGRVAMIPASGSTDPSRSHFAAQARMESGVGPGDRAADGWLGRYLAARGDRGVFDGVSIGSLIAPSLRGYGGAVALADVGDLSLGGRRQVPERIDTALRSMVESGTGPAASAGRGVFAMIDELAALGLAAEPTPPAFPDVPIGHDLWQAARLVRSGTSLGAVALSHGGWDHHDDLGTVDAGRMTTQLQELCGSIAAFWSSVEDHDNPITMVIMSEFGRRVAENSNGGTDHGHGSVMTLIGDGIAGGIRGSWPGLSAADLDEGDVAVSTDYRTVLAEVLDRVVGRDDWIDAVLPGWGGSPSDYVGVAA